MRIVYFRLIAAFFVISYCASATLVVFQWLPGEILLAADSLSAKVTGSEIKGVVECKIHQSGDVFFTIIGVNDDPTIKVDLVSVANHATRTTRGDIVEKFSRFEVLAQPQVERIMRRNVTRQLGMLEKQRVTVVFVDRKSHSLIYRE